jgi:hypothetical protein
MPPHAVREQHSTLHCTALTTHAAHKFIEIIRNTLGVKPLR